MRDAGYFMTNVRKVGKENVGTGKEHFAVKLDEPLFDSQDWKGLKNHQPFYAQINMYRVERDRHEPTGWKKPEELTVLTLLLTILQAA